MLTNEFPGGSDNEESRWCRAQGSTKEGAEPGPASVLPVLSLSALLFYLGRQRGGVRKDCRINTGFNDSCPKAFSKGATQRVSRWSLKRLGAGEGKRGPGSLDAEGQNPRMGPQGWISGALVALCSLTGMDP